MGGGVVASGTRGALTTPSPTSTSTSSIAVQVRAIRIHEASENIRTFWRKENQDIRLKHKGVPLGSAEVTTKQFEEMTQMLNQNGQDIDNAKLLRGIFYFLFICFGLQFLADTFVLGTEPEVCALYTKENPNAPPVVEVQEDMDTILAGGHDSSSSSSEWKMK